MATQNWEKQDDIVKAVNGCLKAIQDAGISIERAELVPACLFDAISCGKKMMMQAETFRAYQIESKPDGKGGNTVSPAELSQFTSHPLTSCLCSL